MVGSFLLIYIFDLSSSSVVDSTRGGNAPQASSGAAGTVPGQPSADATVFSNPAQAESSAISENLARFVSSLSYSAASGPQNAPPTTSRNLRHQRGGGGGASSTSTRHESSGGTRRGTRNAPSLSNPGVHIHGGGGGSSSSSGQSQSHHYHSIQGSGINYRIMQLKNVQGDVAAQMALLHEINQVGVMIVFLP